MSTINPRGRRVGELQARADCCLGKEERTGWGRLIDFGLSSGLMEMMKLLPHGLRNMVHFQDNQTTASLSTSPTWFAKEIIDDSCPSFEVAVVF